MRHLIHISTGRTKHSAENKPSDKTHQNTSSQSDNTTEICFKPNITPIHANSPTSTPHPTYFIPTINHNFTPDHRPPPPVPGPDTPSPEAVAGVTFAEASQAPETKVRMSGASESDITSPVGPVKAVHCWPVSMSHSALSVGRAVSGRHRDEGGAGFTRGDTKHNDS